MYNLSTALISEGAVFFYNNIKNYLQQNKNMILYE